MRSADRIAIAQANTARKPYPCATWATPYAVSRAASASSGSPCSASRNGSLDERNATRASSRPTSTPATTPIAILPTTYQASHAPTPPSNEPPAATSTAAWTKGKVRPSFSPASDVSANRTSPDSLLTVGSSA